MSSYKQLSNQGPPLLSAGASKSRGKRRPISGAISTGHRHRCSAPPFQGQRWAKQQVPAHFILLSANRNFVTKISPICFADILGSDGGELQHWTWTQVLGRPRCWSRSWEVVLQAAGCRLHSRSWKSRRMRRLTRFAGGWDPRIKLTWPRLSLSNPNVLQFS